MYWNAFGFFFDAGMTRTELQAKTAKDFAEAETNWPQHWDRKVVVGENIPPELYETCLRTVNAERELRKQSFVSLGLDVPGTLLRVKAVPGSLGWDKYKNSIRRHLIGGSLDEGGSVLG